MEFHQKKMLVFFVFLKTDPVNGQISNSIFIKEKYSSIKYYIIRFERLKYIWSLWKSF